MTTEMTETPDGGPVDDARYRALLRIYDDMNTTLQLQMVELRAGDVAQGKPMIKKMDELSSVLLALIKAEKAFHDKFKLDAGESQADPDDVRVEIGRKLDRIRGARGAGDISKGTDD